MASVGDAVSGTGLRRAVQCVESGDWNHRSTFLRLPYPPLSHFRWRKELPEDAGVHQAMFWGGGSTHPAQSIWYRICLPTAGATSSGKRLLHCFFKSLE